MPDERSPLKGRGRQLARAGAEPEPPEPTPPVDENVTQAEKDAHIRPRTCTDVLCVALWLASLYGLYLTMIYAWENGDTRRLYHGLNWENQLCGVDAEVSAKPYLYWCTKPSDTALSQGDLSAANLPSSITDAAGHLIPLANAILSPSETMDLLHPICLASCPQDRSTFHPCLQNVDTEQQVPRNFDGSFWVNNTYISHLVQDIETTLFAKRFCLPKENFLVEQLNETLSGSMNAVMYKTQEIVSARRVYILVGGLAILMCYLYLFAIDLLAAPIIYGMLLIATAGSFLTSLYFFYAALRIEIGKALSVNEEALPLVESTNDRNWDLVVGAVCLLIGIAATCFWCCKKNSITFVIAAVKATIRILYDVPQLILLPAVGAVVRGVIFIIFLWGAALLVSAGEVEQVDLTQYVPKGIARTFSHTQDETLYIVYYCFSVFWMWELLLALETFVASYTVVIWYNAPLANGKKRVPCFPVVRAFFVGLTYHLGSLLFGSIILAIFRGAYFLVSLFESQVRGKGDDENDVARTSAACCCCCLQCVEQIVRYLNKGAYVLIAVNSDNYCSAADRALRLMTSNIFELGLLQGATVLFQVLGNVAIPGLGGYLTYLIVRHLEWFNDPASDHFVAQPDLVAVVGALICLAVSLAFMSVFDTVSDAMIYAYITDEEWRQENRLPPNPNIPPNLKKLLPESQQTDDE
mmetsp:Transcript_72216/g.169233  ORF Transcript_72216/g.169233 Transcript_72216/m.169233 type:complete len:695 (+) Transcript_72216:51-2135(+)|eukprot:s856_g10.t1